LLAYRFRVNDIRALPREMNPMTTTDIRKKKGRPIRRLAPDRKSQGAEKTSPRRENGDPPKRVMRHDDKCAIKPQSKRNAQEFILDVGGHRTRWTVLIAASLLIVCIAGFLTSSLLFKDTHPAEATSQKTDVVSMQMTEETAKDKAL
jgi:hypothetical protein